MTETTTAHESGKWSDHCPYSDGMFLRGRETVPSMELPAHHEENFGHFSGSQGLPLEPSWETIIRQLTATSAAAIFLQYCVWRRLAVLVQFGSMRAFWPRDHAHQAHQRAARLQSSHRRTPSCSLSSCFFSMPKGFVRAFDHTRFSHTRWFEKTLVLENTLLGARGCRKKLKPFQCRAWLFAAAMKWPTQDGSQDIKGPPWR